MLRGPPRVVVRCPKIGPQAQAPSFALHALPGFCWLLCCPFHAAAEGGKVSIFIPQEPSPRAKNGHHKWRFHTTPSCVRVNCGLTVGNGASTCSSIRTWTSSSHSKHPVFKLPLSPNTLSCQQCFLIYRVTRFHPSRMRFLVV